MHWREEILLGISTDSRFLHHFHLPSLYYTPLSWSNYFWEGNIIRFLAMKGILPFSVRSFHPSGCLEERSPRSVSAELSMDNSWATWFCRWSYRVTQTKQHIKQQNVDKIWQLKKQNVDVVEFVLLSIVKDLAHEAYGIEIWYMLLFKRVLAVASDLKTELHDSILWREKFQSLKEKIDSYWFCSMLLTPHRFEPAMWLFLCWHWKYMQTHEHAKKHLPFNGRNTRENKHETSTNLEKHEVTKQQSSQVWLLTILITENYN